MKRNIENRQEFGTTIRDRHRDPDIPWACKECKFGFNYTPNCQNCGRDFWGSTGTIPPTNTRDNYQG